MSDLATIADALVSLVNGSGITFAGNAITASWIWSPQWTLEDLETLRIIFVPTARKPKRISRISWNRVFKFSLGVQKRHDGTPGDPSPADKLAPLDVLTESLLELFMAADRVNCGSFGVALDDIDNPVALSDEMLETRTFTSVIDLEYRKVP